MSHDKDVMPVSKDDGIVMHMTFFWSKDVVMLFNGWPNGELGMYILALAVVLILAVIIEFLSIFPVVKPGRSPIVGGLIHASFYGLRMALVYLLMLCVMSYNVGIFVFVVVGHVIGCFLVKYRVISKAASNKGKQIAQQPEAFSMTAEDIRNAIKRDVEETQARSDEIAKVAEMFDDASNRKTEKATRLRSRLADLTESEKKYLNYLDTEAARDYSYSFHLCDVIKSIRHQLDEKIRFQHKFDK